MHKTNFFSSINNTVSQYLKEIKLDILYGFSIYDLLKLYIIGIIQGTISNRASSISFSFFMALFPFLLFVLIDEPKPAPELIYNYRGKKISGIARNESGWNSAYVAGKILEKIGPILAINKNDFHDNYVVKKSD